MVVKKYNVPVIIILLLSIIASPLLTSANTIYVDASGSGDFTDIQSAVNAASSGDIIYVRDGVYPGGVVINKEITIFGESKNAIVECNGENGIEIHISGVIIEDLSIRNASSGYAGILVYKAAVIKNCNFSYNDEGLHTVGMTNGMILRNIFYNNVYGLTCINSRSDTIRENYFIDNRKAISLGADTSDNILHYNNFIDNVVDVDDESGLNYWDYEHVGNYWDRYNGVDGDGDGIGDTPYKIDESKGIQDHYPLIEPYAGIDIFPPDIVGLQASPQIQIPGGSVNITCQIIDNVEVNSTFINITLANGSYLNNSLGRIGNTTHYYFNLTYSEKGVYYYYVWANDTSNNSVKSGLHKFVIAYKPNAVFSFTPLNPTDLDIITFDGSSSSDPDGYITNYTWNFGDGSYAYTAVAAHKYSADGTYTVTLTVYDNDGAWDTMSKEIVVSNIPPVANFTFSPSNATVGQTVFFNDTSYDADGEVRIWQWDFGDGNTTGGGTGFKNVTYAYAKNGIFNITLTVTDNDDGKDNITKQITVKDVIPPEINNLTAYPNPQEIQGNVNITCNISDDVAVAMAKVNITGPLFSLNESMHHISGTDIWYCDMPYNISGNYTYFVWTEDPSGNSNKTAIFSFKIIIPAEPPKIADVQSVPTVQQYGFAVNISCYATDNVEVAEVRVNITHNGTIIGNFTMNPYSVDEKGNGFYYYNSTYLSLGNYTYFIWDMDINGYTNTSEIKNFSIIDTTPPEIKNISSRPPAQMPDGYVNISADITDNMVVKHAYIKIEFPNGTVLDYDMCHNSRYYFNRTYNLLGVYNYTIFADDALGNTNSYSNSFFITNFPIADFGYNPLNPTDMDTLHFSDNSSDLDGFIVNWTWNFGDGNVSYEQNPSHQYADDGTYNVTLTVRDNDGAVNITEKAIYVGNVLPSADFSYLPPNPADIDIITFNASASHDPDGSIANYTWDFGDGNTDYGCVSFHRYISDGNYTVKLTVEDEDGGINFTEKNITVLNCPPVSNFSCSLYDFTVYLIDRSSDSDGFIVNRTWDFGDGNRSYENNTFHTYAHEGVYNISLTVEDDDGGTDISYKMVSVGITLTANFSYYPPNPVSGDQVSFFDNSSYASSWKWAFGDGSYSSLQNPAHVYPLGNYYNVTLTVFNGSKNASISKTLEVGTKIQIFENEKNVVNYIPWLGNEIQASALASLIGSDIMPAGSVVSMECQLRFIRQLYCRHFPSGI
ncbi:MAG: PKD domain-containing protein [Thermoplasmata archaeon]|nr:MAG: PKD domain-containing protein [Thermoplasmata archaeon]